MKPIPDHTIDAFLERLAVLLSPYLSPAEHVPPAEEIAIMPWPEIARFISETQ